jgi:hypothetical protein
MIDIGYERLMLVESEKVVETFSSAGSVRNSMFAGISDKPQTTSHNEITYSQPTDLQHQNHLIATTGTKTNISA